MSRHFSWPTPVDSPLLQESCEQAWSQSHALWWPCGWLIREGSCLPLKMGVNQVYHVDSAETNVIDPIAEGTAGYAIGLV
jgi:hypothetical protein